MKQYYAYIMANRSRTLYTGVTSDLERRVWEHKHMVTEGFTRRYLIDRLVYYEVTDDVTSAIAREKQIKGWSRSNKLALIESVNPGWRDLSEDFADSTAPRFFVAPTSASPHPASLNDRTKVPSTSSRRVPLNDRKGHADA